MMVDHMFETTLPTGNIEVPVFIVLLILISIWAYLTKIEGREQYFYYVNWIALAVFASFFVFVKAHPYWIVLMAPYMIILMTVNADLMKINLLLEFFAGTAVSFFYCATFRTYMAGDTFSYLLLPRLGFEPKNTGYGAGFAALVEKGELATYFSLLFAVFVACMAAFVYLNRPANKIRTGEWTRTVGEKPVFDHGMIILRLLMLVVFILGSFFFSYIY